MPEGEIGVGELAAYEVGFGRVRDEAVEITAVERRGACVSDVAPAGGAKWSEII